MGHSPCGCFSAKAPELAGPAHGDCLNRDAGQVQGAMSIRCAVWSESACTSLIVLIV